LIDIRGGDDCKELAPEPACPFFPVIFCRVPGIMAQTPEDSVLGALTPAMLAAS
jgi:hypothetical protein